MIQFNKSLKADLQTPQQYNTAGLCDQITNADKPEYVCSIFFSEITKLGDVPSVPG